MLFSIINPKVNYDESSWAISLAWDSENKHQMIFIEGETSFQSLFAVLAGGKDDVSLAQSFLNKDDIAGREMLFFHEHISEFSGACKTFLVDKQEALNLIHKFSQGSKHSYSISCSSHQESVDIHSVDTKMNPQEYLNTDEWLAAILLSLGIEVPATYEEFSQLEGIIQHQGSIAAMPSLPGCIIS